MPEDTGIELSKYRGLIIDLDGVVWLDNKIIHKADETISYLKNAGMKLVFISNTSTKSMAKMMKKINNLNLPINNNEVVLASRESVKYVSNLNSGNNNVYIIGSEGLKREAAGFGLNVISDEQVKYSRVDFVLVGWDSRINALKLKNALNAILKGAKFVAINKDPTHPGKNDIRPATGAIVGAVEAMVDKEPDILVGKPETYLLNIGLNRLNLSKEAVAIVGDTLSSDIKAGKNIGIDTILVLTGNTSSDRISYNVAPDYIIESISDLLD